MQKKLDENDYVNIQSFMINDLNLSGASLIIYAKIDGFSKSKKGYFCGGNEYLASWANCSVRQVQKILEVFEEKNLIKRQKRHRATDLIQSNLPEKISCEQSSFFTGTKFAENDVLPELFSPLPEQSSPNITDNTNINNTINISSDFQSYDTTCVKPVDNLKKEKKKSLLEREPENEYEIIEKAYLENWKELFKSGKVETENPVVNYSQTRSLLKHYFKRSPDINIFLKAMKNGMKDEFILKGGYSLSIMLSSAVLNRLINAKQEKKHRIESDNMIGDKWKDYGYVDLNGKDVTIRKWEQATGLDYKTQGGLDL